MAESTNAITLAELTSEVMYFLGYGYDTNALTTIQSARVVALCKQGIRQAYWPPPVQLGNAPQPVVHEWSWFRPAFTFNTVAATYTYNMTDDFGGFDGPLTISSTTQSYRRIDVTNESRIRTLQSLNPGRTGIPEWAALRPIAPVPATPVGTRYALWLYPTPDAVYAINGTYKVLPDAVTGGTTYPYGGAQFSECLKESCLAMAELSSDDQSGQHAAAFQRLLTAAIIADQNNGPECYGYSGDERTTGLPVQLRQPSAGVTYNGVLYP